MHSNPTAPESWIFTFGSGQQHDGRYVVIPGSYDEARAEMLRHFGNAWSFQYASPERAGVDEFGMVELPRSEWPEQPAEVETGTAPEPANPLRAAVADILHRIANDIEQNEMPLPKYRFKVGGAVESRADLEYWAECLDVEIKAGGTDGTIPVIRKAFPVGAGLSVEVEFQSPAEPKTSEIERLRARVAELEAQRDAVADRALEESRDGHVYQCCKVGRISRHESWCPTVNPAVAAQVRTDDLPPRSGHCPDHGDWTEIPGITGCPGCARITGRHG